MKKINFTCSFLLFALILSAQTRMVKVADIEKEKRLETNFDVKYGVIYINPTGSDRLFGFYAKYNKDAFTPVLEIERDGNSASLAISAKGNKKSNSNSDDNIQDFDLDETAKAWKGIKEQGNSDLAIYLDLGKKVEHDLNINIGAGTGNIDLSGLKINNLEINSGAGKFYFQCNEPNPNLLREGKISTGVGDVRLDGLLNLNFKRLKIDGGVGKFSLNFNGKSEGNHSVDISTGVGSVVIRVPYNVGVRLNDDSGFFSNLRVPRDFRKRGDIYQSPNFQEAASTIEFNISSGMGSISFETINN